MIDVSMLKIEGETCMAMSVQLPGSPPLLLIVAERGFIMCGFLNIDAAERLGVVAAVVSGVDSFEDMLNAQVKAATSKAEALGVKAGVKGIDALKNMV